ncbi:class II fructose-bisphosphate aldolase [Gulosibacter sp. ACHW.36C]|uniref:Class II fructose-bisphosphate aldolase n=1 Tax=Gulosibacter sediminis TaxID=1729695 RepID=A0ABY4MXJ8_9MICO|nr:class II fructose-bisphosphate aldolase [Gulosibacter sediminis]UQN13927.1 class II fructose-bisphosphate aldolase [Gulosibacter sediminis]
MPLIDLTTVAAASREAGKGLGAFNVVQLETAQVLVDAAAAAARPVVLQVSQNAVKYHGGHLAPIGRATIEVAKAAEIEAIVHLDHADDVELIREAVDLGFTSVMYDGSHLPFEQNLATTIEVVEFCHAAGVTVEAELGEVGGKDGVHAPGVRTDPDDAADFVAKTGVDLLAVAVGSSHAMTERSADLDLELIERMAATVPVPLVLHGSSGVSDAGMVAAIRAGMTKINVSTHLNVQFTAAVREYLTANPDAVDPRKYVAAGNQVVRAEVERLLGLYAA